MRLLLTTLLATYGHYVHGCSDRKLNEHADGSSRRAVHLRNCDLARPARPRSLGLRNLGAEMDHPQDEARPLKGRVQLKIGFAIACFVMGTLFALPTKATTFNNINFESIGAQNTEISRVSYNSTYRFFDTFYDKSEIPIHYIENISFQTAVATGSAPKEVTIEITSDQGTWSDTITVADTSYTTSTISFTDAYSEDGTWVFSFRPNFTDVGTQNFFAATQTSGILSNLYTECPNKDSIVGCTLTNDSTWVPMIEINYFGATTSSEPIETELPSSTYNGTFSDYLPSITFSTGTLVHTGGEFEATMNEIFGTSTWTGFPMCFVAPWFQLFDIFNGASKNEQEGTSIVMGHGFNSSSTEINLNSASATFAAIGVKNLTDVLFPFFEAIMWMLFGLMVWKDIMHEGEEEID